MTFAQDRCLIKVNTLRKMRARRSSRGIGATMGIVPTVPWATWPQGNSLLRQARWMWPDEAKVSPYGWYRNGHKRNCNPELHRDPRCARSYMIL